MNEEALQYSYDLFKIDGYNGSFDDYKKLVKEDNDALEHSYGLFKSDGYNGELEDFTKLIVVEPVKNEAVAAGVAPVTAEKVIATPSRTEMITGVKPEDTVSGLVDGSLEQQEPKIIDNEIERYLQYNVDGKENLVYESDFKVGEDGLNFDEFAESNNLKVRESLAAPVIKTKSRKSFILDEFAENAYKQPKEVSGFRDGVQNVFNNNLETVDKIASSINGINYATQNDESLENLDAFAQQNKNKTIVVYAEGEDDEGYKESYNYIKDLNKKVNALKKIRSSEKGITRDQLNSLNQLEEQLNGSYDEHMRKFKVLRSNVEFITSKNLSKQRLESKGEDTSNYIVGERKPEEVVDDYDYYGRIYLSPKEKEINSLYEKQKYTTGDDLLAIEKRLEVLKEGLGNELYDPITGKMYNLDTAPKELVDSYERSNNLFAKTEVDQLKNLSFKKQSQLIGAAEDLYNTLNQSDYLNTRGGFGASIKAMLPVLKQIVKSKKLPANLSDLKSILSDSSRDGFYNLSPQLGYNFNKTLTEYLEINRALKTNTNVLTSKDKEYFNELLDATVNKFGSNIETKSEKQNMFKEALLESGFTEDSVNEMNKGNSLNLGQDILRGVPDLGEFVFQVAVTRGLTGNSLARVGKFTQSLINTAYKGNKYAVNASKYLIPAVVEGGEFALTTALTNTYKEEESSVGDSFLSGFSMGLGGKLLKGAVSSISKKVLGNKSVQAKMYDYTLARNIGDSKFLSKAYDSFLGASGGAGAYISGGILLDPFEFDYSNIGHMYVEEASKMWLLGKFQKTLMTGGKSVKKGFEDISNDVLRFSDLNNTSYKAAKQLNIDTKVIKKPTEESNNQVQNAFDAAKSKVTKKLLKKEITREEAEKQLDQLDGSRKALDVQIGINQTKEIVKQQFKEGKIVSPGRQYLVGKKVAKSRFNELTPQELTDLSNMSPESVLLNSGIDFNPDNMNVGVAYVDQASKINSILDGKQTFISYKLGGTIPNGYKPYEFKSTNKKTRADALSFLYNKERADTNLESLEKQYKKANEGQDKEILNNSLYKAKREAEKYARPTEGKPLGGELYTELQSELKGSTFTELNKDYLEYIKQGGDPSKIVLHDSKESFKKAQVNLKNKDYEATAFFNAQTGARHINMEAAMNIKDIAAIAHEGGHWILKDVIKDKEGNITPQGIKMIDDLLDSMPSKDRNLIEQEVKERYFPAGEKAPAKKEYYEENLTAFIELVKEGKIKNDTSLRNTLESLVPFLKRNKLKNLEIDIDTGTGVLQLLESYAKGEKGVNEAIKRFQSKQQQVDVSNQKSPKSKSVEDVQSEITALEDLYDEQRIDYYEYEGKMDALEAKLEQAKKAPKEKPKTTKDTTKVNVSNIEEQIDALNNDFYDGFIDEIEHEQKLDILEAKLNQAKLQVSKPKEAKKQQEKTVKDSVEKFKKEVSAETVSDRNKNIAKTNEDIANEMLELGANKISDIKDPVKQKEIIDKLGKNNLGAVTNLTKKATAAGKDLAIDDNLKVGYDEFFSGFSEELSALINSYKVKVDGKKVPFGAYMNKNLPLRYGQILDKALKGRIEGSKSLDVNSGEKGFAGTIAAERSADFDAVSSADRGLPAGELIDVTTFGKVKDKVEDIKESIDLKDIDVADLTYRRIQDDYSGDVGADIVGLWDKNAKPKEGQDRNDFQKLAERIEGTRTLNYGKDTGGEAEVRAMQGLFLDYNDVVKFIKTIPEFNVAPFETTIDKQGRSIDLTEDARGYSTGISNKLLKKFYEPYIDPKATSKDKNVKKTAITSPSGRGKGKTSQVAKVYRLKPEYRGKISRQTVQELQKTIGITPAGEAFIPMKGTNRTEFGTALQGLTKMYATNVANTIIRKKIVDEGITSETKSVEKVLADIGGGKSKVMFSKKTDVEEEIDKLFNEFSQEFTKEFKDKTLRHVDSKGKINVKGVLEELKSISKDILTDSERRTFETAISIAQKNPKYVLDGAKAIKAFRNILIKEYQKLGDLFTYNKLEEDFNKKEITEQEKIKLLKNFFANNTRSGRTGKLSGVTTNEQAYDRVESILGKEVLKKLGFTVGKRKTVKGKEISWIKHNNKGILGALDITSLKSKGFLDDQTRDTVNKDSNIAITEVVDFIDDLKSKKNSGVINEDEFSIRLKSYLNYNKIDQRGLIRKISRPGFQIKTSLDGKTLRATDLYLEHEISADEIISLLKGYANDKIKNKEVIEKLQEAKVNIIPKYMADILPKYIKGKKNAESYNDPAFKKELEAYREKDLIDYISPEKVAEYKEEVRFSKGRLDTEFNKIIENKTGILATDNISEVKAKMMADNKRKINFFIPPSAEDFVGLLYATLGKGKVGDKQMKFYDRTLIKPYARAMQAITRDRLDLGRAFKNTRKEFKATPKDLKKKVPNSLFTKEQAVRVYIWDSTGKEVPGLKVEEVNELANYVADNKQLKDFADQVMRLNPGSKYTSPDTTWATGNITTDLLETLNTSRRAKHLGRWQQNVDEIFSTENLNKLEAAYGTKYRKAMENMLTRMKTGRNRTYGTDTQTAKWIDWMNGSVGAIMFFNTRSAALQTISSANFINFGDNNIIAAGKAFANQKQYWTDFAKLINSDYLLERRDSLKINVNEADIAEAASKNGVRGAINYVLKLGFTPTKFADSFAIASGGATFYRNRIKALVKNGMDPVAAEKAAMRDFIEKSEESQQSSRPDKISQEQAGPLGRVILAFANTPAQYARIIKKAASDLKNRRGSDKENISKILYYSVAQNLLFNALQQAIFAVAFGDGEEDEGVLDDKKLNVVNGMLDGVIRGTGVAGAVFSVVKNVGLKIYKESQKKNPKYENIDFEAMKISPPISSKISKIRSAGRTFSWDMKEIKAKGLDITSPAIGAGAKVISATTNLPLDRVVRKIENLKAASDSELETYKRLALTLGWGKWELGIEDEKWKDPNQKPKSKGRKTVKRKTVIR